MNDKTSAIVDVIDQLPSTLKSIRLLRGLSIRQAASQIGVDSATLHRIEAGENFTVKSARAILEWLGSRHG